MKIELTNDEISDLLSALSYFQSDYPDKKGSIFTRKAMAELTKKLWKSLKKSKWT